LTDSQTLNRGYFRADVIETMLKSHSEGMDHSKEIFSLLNLEIWQRAFLTAECVAC
jgi:hypothetical protein